jgi:hypothetical protein
MHGAGILLRPAAHAQGVAAVLLEELPFGLTWRLDEPLARSSQALVDDRRLWLIDPTDEPAALERALALGRPAAVLSFSIATTATAPRRRSAWACRMSRCLSYSLASPLR